MISRNAGSLSFENLEANSEGVQGVKENAFLAIPPNGITVMLKAEPQPWARQIPIAFDLSFPARGGAHSMALISVVDCDPSTVRVQWRHRSMCPRYRTLYLCFTV